MKRLDPFWWLDLYDRTGRPDHTKLVPFALVVLAVVFHAEHNRFAWWELVILGAIAFGPRMYALFLRRSSFSFGGSVAEVTTASTSATTAREEITERQAILSRRPPELGFELPQETTAT